MQQFQSSKRLTENPNTIKFNDLTPQLQAAIKHEDVNFQGEYLAFCEIVSDESSAYVKLSSDQIIKMLNSEAIQI